MTNADSTPVHVENAAKFLEQALKAGPADPQVAYLLALAYKRQGRTGDARQALRKITPPDANVLLQLGLLSLQEKQLAQAEQELARSWEMDATCYETGYNLVLTRLALGDLDAGLALLPPVIKLGPTREERHFLRALPALCDVGRKPGAEFTLESPLHDLREEQERQLLELVRNLGHLEIGLMLLRGLAALRPHSPAVQDAYVEAALVRTRTLVDEAKWGEAERLLSPLVQERRSRPAVQAALFNLLGCCSCLNQDFEHGVRHFSAAIKLAGNDPRLQQNLALAFELQGEQDEAEPHWNRFFDLLDGRIVAPPGQPDYVQRLSFEGLNRLATLYAEKGHWDDALTYLRRAQHLRPEDTDLLERLFHLYNQVKRPEEARRVLARLRELHPTEPQYDLYELDLIETKTLKDIERVLTEIDEIRARHPQDPRVEDRAVRMVGNVVPLISDLCDRLTEQLSNIIDQVRSLPNYQINWPAVHDAMRDLVREFRKLRRIVNKCLPLVANEQHRRIVRELADHIDRKIEVCQSIGS